MEGETPATGGTVPYPVPPFLPPGDASLRKPDGQAQRDHVVADWLAKRTVREMLEDHRPFTAEWARTAIAIAFCHGADHGRKPWPAPDGPASEKPDAPLLELPGHSACGCTAKNILYPELDRGEALEQEQARANTARDAGTHPTVDENGVPRGQRTPH